DLERERRKRRYRDKLFIRMWKGIKNILKNLSLRSRKPQLSRVDLPDFSFLSQFGDKVAGDLRDGSNEASG
ncbi:hypothetical protein HAX54_000805, partial [Datura stramonium]|nr:hypothetical protein [Datura stramonium]